MRQELTCVEICAGAGGQGLGLEQAGFAHVAAVEFTDYLGRHARLELDTYVVNMCATHRSLPDAGARSAPRGGES